MDMLVYLVVFLIGICIGSFLNVCIYRLPNEESIVTPASHCTSCDNAIKWYDLIPLVSWVFLRGKCRHCKEKISMRYFLVELFTGIMFLMVFISFGVSFKTLVFIIFTCFLIMIGFIDYDTQDIYDLHIIIPAVIGIIYLVYLFAMGESIMTNIYGSLLGGGIITLIILLTKGMGWGDAELCALCGLYLGFKNTIVMLFLAIVFGGIVGVYVLVTRKKGKKDAMPFGPFIVVGAFLSMLYGSQLMEMYIAFILR